jgi:phosphoribosylanthranilate isomerase
VTKVKICGITNIEDALAACEAGADALGFVFAPEGAARNRYIAPEAARSIIEALPPFVTTVAVCVNEPPEKLRAYLAFADYVQLCGDEPLEDCIPLADRAIKAFRAGESFVPAMMTAYRTAAWLLDAAVAGAHGGTGAKADWTVARAAAGLGRPVILAGGLTPENVAEAIAAVGPYAVDVSGGVECAPGKKDHERVREFIRNAKCR